MNIPSGLTEAEVLQIIDKVAKKHCFRKFGYLQTKDLYQHASMFCVSRIDRFDPSKIKTDNLDNLKRALESWLSRIISNQMKNFYRDNVDKTTERKNGKTITHIVTQNSLEQNERRDDLVEKNLPTPSDNHDLLCKMAQKMTDAEFEIFDGLLSGDNVTLELRTQVIELCRKNL